MLRFSSSFFWAELQARGQPHLYILPSNRHARRSPSVPLARPSARRAIAPPWLTLPGATHWPSPLADATRPPARPPAVYRVPPGGGGRGASFASSGAPSAGTRRHDRILGGGVRHHSGQRPCGQRPAAAEGLLSVSLRSILTVTTSRHAGTPARKTDEPPGRNRKNTLMGLANARHRGHIRVTAPDEVVASDCTSASPTPHIVRRQRHHPRRHRSQTPRR